MQGRDVTDGTKATSCISPACDAWDHGDLFLRGGMVTVRQLAIGPMGLWRTGVQVLG